jgi:hypothetical protein
MAVLNIVDPRVILKTIDGQIIVRPTAPEVVNLINAPGCSYVLNDAGKDAWNNGDDITHEHISTYLNYATIKKCIF